MIKTKSVYDPAGKSDGEGILVTRFRPWWIPKKKLLVSGWMRNLSPSAELLNLWKDGRISWEEYAARYNKEMSAQRTEIEELAEKARRGTITLLCFEREDDPCCHRHLLKKMIEGKHVC